MTKALTGRRRPYADVPVRSRLRRVPRSSSFPSGHAANAAAFAIGAAIEIPSLAAPGIALASAVGASRVATGVHYPSDIRVYLSWRASSVDVRAVDGQRIWLSTDGEVATAAPGFIHGKHPHALVVYRKADD